MSTEFIHTLVIRLEDSIEGPLLMYVVPPSRLQELDAITETDLANIDPLPEKYPYLLRFDSASTDEELAHEFVRINSLLRTES